MPENKPHIDTFFFSENTNFLADLYKKYLVAPQEIPERWQKVFSSVGDTLSDFNTEEKGPSWKQQPKTKKATQPAPKSDTSSVTQQMLSDSLEALMLIRLYRVRGHLLANLNPLEDQVQRDVLELQPYFFGFSEEDWDRPIFLNGVLGFQQATLREIMEALRQAYCGSIGVEFMHMVEPEQKSWIQQHMENDSPLKEISIDQKEEILKHLIAAESFEQFLNTKHKGAKRFGLEGCESTIPCLKEIIKTSASHGVEDVVLGMAHRGRLNVLANIMEKPLEKIFYEFTKEHQYCDSVEGSGDVKYHLGCSSKTVINGNEVSLSLTPNPSHLEAVDPVVLGRVRARQDKRQDKARKKVMGIILHGDAAFPGQGIVAECFGLSDLQGYKSGGTMHVVINNQIGFTTAPHASRSSTYSSDLAKSIGAPIFHVNGDDPEAVVLAARMASEFRQKFQQDVVVDIIGYRRFGHNETDDPSFTQPQMYQQISNHESVRHQYEKRFSEGQLSSFTKEREKELEEAYARAQKHDPIKPDWMRDQWSSYKVGSLEPFPSKVTVSHLKGLLEKLTQEPPQGFTLHKRMKRLLDAKKNMIAAEKGIDWGTAEALAFATILEEGNPIRLSGQDSGRGTFSQRHSIWVDQKIEETFVPLNHIGKEQASFEVLNSPLSEVSVLGFEYGYTLSAPETLVLWEAQFGDFANGAQVIMDQFVSSAESKWHRLSGLVMLLPHGYEGQGPEHSSARLERYLQLCAENNMHVAYCSTPASYYHILRRQILGPYRKPLVLMTPKSLLRHPLATSTLQELSEGSAFKSVIEEVDASIQPKNVQRVILCSGKVYYDLLEKRRKEKSQDVAIIRLEELYPFPEKELAKVLASYKGAEAIWCQEEPENMGAWHFIDRRLENVLTQLKFKNTRPTYVGRKASASPATGFAQVHASEQAALVQEALNGKGNR